MAISSSGKELSMPAGREYSETDVDIMTLHKYLLMEKRK
jgi:hypothetical protein